MTQGGPYSSVDTRGDLGHRQVEGGVIRARLVSVPATTMPNTVDKSGFRDGDDANVDQTRRGHSRQ
jgi:hypothetical protein